MAKGTMTFSAPEENTLGVVIGRGRRNISEATRRVVREAVPRRASLGTGFIGIGAVVVLGLRSIYGLGWFVSYWASGTYPDPLPAGLAWAVLAVAIITTLVVTRVNGDQLPEWMFWLFLSGLGAAITLDLVAILPLHDVGRYATAAVTSGMALLVIITMRRTIDILIAAGVIGAVLAAAMLLTSELNETTIAQQATTLAFAVLPAVIGVVIVRGFRRLVQVELDRVLVQSTVSAPRFAVGMLASEELARLDLAAEELLESVATGRTALPLQPAIASRAAQLATELRLHLIEGRRETWLFHAITESDLLGKTVTLTDKGSLAGLLDPQQRDGLLQAAWLLVSDQGKRGTPRTVQLSIEPGTEFVPAEQGRKIGIHIALTSSGVPRNRVDPATWDAIRKVGQYSDSTQNSSLRVDIRVLVDNPADQ
jgi:hypothetical protein